MKNIIFIFIIIFTVVNIYSQENKFSIMAKTENSQYDKENKIISYIENYNWIELQKQLHINPVRDCFTITVINYSPVEKTDDIQLVIDKNQKPEKWGYSGEVKAKWNDITKDLQEYILKIRDEKTYDIDIK